MPLLSPKGCLPHGWIVQRSKHYPDRVYYFNINTGASAWECPPLDPPRVLTEDEVKTDMNNKSSPVSNNPEVEEPPQNSEKGLKPITPPTAVVVPVVHKQKQNPILSKKKKKKCKSAKGAKSKTPEVMKSKKGIVKKIRKISPLKKPDSEERVVHGKLEASGKLEEQSAVVESPKSSLSSSNESSAPDVEMHDVSLDLLDDLAEKKETVFDTTACYYIVVDTNVLIRELNLINELKDTPLDGCGPPHIFIPWVVIQELDKLKSQKLKGASPSAPSEAIRYLNSVLANHPRFHGQTPKEAEQWAKTYSTCNDDKILECCMALKDKMPAEKVILLTNDKNLVNKALICKINVHNFESMMKKVTPDTVFNYEEIKMNKKRKKEKASEESQSPHASTDVLEKRLFSNRDSSKCQIHTIMANARLFLKDVLYKFLSREMYDAYGDKWLQFPIDLTLLKGLLEGVKKYWVAVFSLFFREKDKRNFELLLEKANRPEGYLGDRDECLVILSAIQEVFRQIKRRQPDLQVPIEKIQDYRVACVNSFIVFSEAESSIRSYEEASVRSLLDNNWTAINQMSGMILDYYNVPHGFIYDKTTQTLPDFEIRRIMTILYPAVQQIRTLLKNINEAIQKSKPVKSSVKRLYSALKEFIPSLRLHSDPDEYPLLTMKALEKFFTCPQNREKLAVGIEQIEQFHTKLDEVLRVMLLPHLRNKSPEPETMICD